MGLKKLLAFGLFTMILTGLIVAGGGSPRSRICRSPLGLGCCPGAALHRLFLSLPLTRILRRKHESRGCSRKRGSPTASGTQAHLQPLQCPDQGRQDRRDADLRRHHERPEEGIRGGRTSNRPQGSAVNRYPPEVTPAGIKVNLMKIKQSNIKNLFFMDAEVAYTPKGPVIK